MLIGELSRRTGLSRDTIRFYEKKGLIPAKLRRENNYKEYPEQIFNRLMLIRKVKGMGFTLTEIEAFFNQWNEEGASCQNQVSTLENKITRIDEQILLLTKLKESISN